MARGYIQASAPAPGPELLSAVHDGAPYRFQLRTAHVAERRTGPVRPLRAHAHAVYHLVLFTEGINRFCLDGRMVPCEPGTLVLCSPGQRHNFAPADAGSAAYHEITFSLESASGPLRVPFAKLLSLYAGVELVGAPAMRRLEGLQFRWFARQYERLMDHIEASGPLRWFRAWGTVWQMLSALVEDSPPDGPPAGPLEEVKEYLEAHFADPLRVANLAQRAHVTPEHFCRAFKARFGCSPIAHQRRLRIRAARNLLATTALRCKEIARRLGFSDVYGFSRAFSRSEGLSPRAFRARNRPA
ncbi:MAG TPA: hypothetical protein DCX07_04980 [Phycisphaerales bacterium]|nr:hypothetical protein [Phycisphaerales bacterium]